MNAASLTIAEQYVQAFNKLARTNNTLILPANAGDVSNLVAQAMSIYSKVSSTPVKTKVPVIDTNNSMEELFSDDEDLQSQTKNLRQTDKSISNDTTQIKLT